MFGRIASILTVVGGLLVAVVGLIELLPAFVPVAWFTGIAFLVLGVGVALYAFPVLTGQADQHTATVHDRPKAA